MDEHDQRKRLEQEFKKANTKTALENARQDYIRLLELDEWRVTNRALNDSKAILREMGVSYPTEFAIVEKVFELLQADHPMKAIGMGEPPGIHGIAHVLKGGFLEDLYIKIKIEDDQVYILSFHR